jgi:hypothetical protein
MMQIEKLIAACLLLLASPSFAQGKHVWVLRSPGEMVEHDPATFAVKQTVKVPAEAVTSPQNVFVNRLGQILFAPALSLPLAESDMAAGHKAWLWDCHAAATIDLGARREVGKTGSNEAVTESAPTIVLSSDGKHLFWFANQARRLEREEIDLSTTTNWQAWETDLSGGAREELETLKMPECRCPTGSCEETCAYGVAWSPEDGVDKFFFMTQFVAGKTEPLYKATTLYREEGEKWTANALAEPLRRVLDAASEGDVIVEAIPDTACCGWVNQSNDQTLVRIAGKKKIIFDEQATYQNPDYDVSFFTSNAKLSPDLAHVAMTVTATATSNEPIQLSEQGQANPEESKRIRKSLGELPAVEVKSMEDPPKRVAFVPHATLVGWINDREVLIVEDHLLVVYDVASGARRKSGVKAEDTARVFLR